MAIAVGDKIPDIELTAATGDGPSPVRTGELLGTGKVVLFGVPGAFTPTCSDYHLPGFVIREDELHAKGVTTIACVSVNDPFVMGAWRAAQNVGDAVVLLADGNAEFTKAMGLELDASGIGMGTRSHRFVAVIEDGTITHLNVESNPGALEVSSADAVLALL